MKLQGYCIKCGKELWRTSHYCPKCLLELSRKYHRKEIDSKKEFDEEFKKLKLVYVDDLARDYLEMLEQSPIFLSEMPFKREKARKIINRIQELGLFIHSFRFHPKRKHNAEEIVLYYSGQEKQVVGIIQYLYRNMRLPIQFREARRKLDYEKEKEYKKGTPQIA